MASHNQNGENLIRQKGESRLKRIWDQVRWDEEINQITFTNNEAEEALSDAYFAERKEEEVPIEGATVEVRRETYVARRGYYISTFATEHGIDNWQDLADANKDVLPDPNNPPAEVELIIPNSEEVPTEIVVSYEPVRSITLGNDTYIVVKGFALQEKWATIKVFEKEPYLLMETEDNPLTFLEYGSLDPDGDDLINENQTEFKAQFNDQGEAIIKIELRPERPEGENTEDTVYQEWQEKFEPIVEKTENETRAVETSIRPIARPENLDTTVTPTDHSSFKIIDYLFLKVNVEGDQGSYEQCFPEERGEYFKLENNCCSQDITKEQITSIAVHASERNVETHLTGINEAFNDNDINTCLRRLHFLAQVIHESGSFRYTEELGVGESAYEGFKGRGLMQLTFRSNYEAYGNFVNEDFTSSQQNKEKLEINPHAARSAGWFWAQNAELNDNADDNDLIYITYRINGGFNGYNDRLKYVTRGFEVLLNSCNNSNSETIDYIFSESKTYNEQKGSFGWGVWHDPGTDKRGCTKNREKAMEGYERFISLNNATGGSTPSRNWYGFDKNNIRSFVEGRINILKN